MGIEILLSTILFRLGDLGSTSSQLVVSRPPQLRYENFQRLEMTTQIASSTSARDTLVEVRCTIEAAHGISAQVFFSGDLGSPSCVTETGLKDHSIRLRDLCNRIK